LASILTPVAFNEAGYYSSVPELPGQIRLKNGRKMCYLSTRAEYDIHLRLIGKHVVDFY